MTPDQDILAALASPDAPQAWNDPRGRIGPSIRERLMAGVVYVEGCWLVSSQPSQRYPTMSILNRRFGRHRVMFYLTHGRWPIGGQVRHTCDTPMCINPMHLIEGTAADNTADMMARGRQRPGGRRKR